jgi:hypothetical protein
MSDVTAIKAALAAQEIETPVVGLWKLGHPLQGVRAAGVPRTVKEKVELHGRLAPLIRPVFARVYGRNLDRAIPRLQEWFRR